MARLVLAVACWGAVSGLAFAPRPCRRTGARQRQSARVVAMGSGGGGDDDPDYYANPVTKLLGQFLPGAGSDGEAGAGSADQRSPLDDEIDWDEPKAKVGLEEMVRLLDAGIREREWFVSGRVMPALFADDFR